MECESAERRRLRSSVAPTTAILRLSGKIRPAILNRQSSGGQLSDGIRVSDFFLFKHKRRQIVRRATVRDIYGLLQNDGAVIVFVVSKMHSAAADLHAALDRGLMHMMAVESVSAKRRNQRWMNVDHPPQEIIRNVQQT